MKITVGRLRSLIREAMMGSNFQVTSSSAGVNPNDWEKTRKGLQTHFTFQGMLDGDQFVLTVPVQFQFDESVDPDGTSVNVFVEESDAMLDADCTLKVNGKSVSKGADVYEKIMEQDFSSEWDALSSTLQDAAKNSPDASEFLADLADAREEQRDPYGYRGLSRKDFY